MQVESPLQADDAADHQSHAQADGEQGQHDVGPDQHEQGQQYLAGAQSQIVTGQSFAGLAAEIADHVPQSVQQQHGEDQIAQDRAGDFGKDDQKQAQHQKDQGGDGVAAVDGSQQIFHGDTSLLDGWT